MSTHDNAPTPPAAAPTLPGKVQGQLNEIRECAEAIVRNLREDIAPELRGNPWVETAACHAAVIVQDFAAITRHHPPLARPAAVTADARELAERIRVAVFAGESHPDSERDAIAAVLAPVVERLKEAEADMAESLRLAQNCKDDMAAAEAKLAEAVRERDALRAEVERLTKKQPINTHVRLFDLVRFMRSELHAADLITNDEYAWLCQHTFPGDPKAGSPSPRRLEGYDDLRAKLAAAQEALKAVYVVRERIVKAVPEYAYEMNMVDRALNDAARREGGAK